MSILILPDKVPPVDLTEEVEAIFGVFCAVKPLV
jgi:hypothetical protein